jgi:hypothetical protein
MTMGIRFIVTAIHPRVGRYLKRQAKRIQSQFWEVLERISDGRFRLMIQRTSLTRKARSIARTAMP